MGSGFNSRIKSEQTHKTKNFAEGIAGINFPPFHAEIGLSGILVVVILKSLSHDKKPNG